MNMNIIATRQPKYVCLRHIMSTNPHSNLIELGSPVPSPPVICDYETAENVGSLN